MTGEFKPKMVFIDLTYFSGYADFGFQFQAFMFLGYTG